MEPLDSAPRLLLVLPQLPQDPSSGAARSCTTICEMLAGAGFTVRALATTAIERRGHENGRQWLEYDGFAPTAHKAAKRDGLRPELTFESRGVSYRLLDSGAMGLLDWPKLYNRQFDLLFDDELKRFQPDLIFTYGGLPGDVRHRQRARRQGIRVVFGLRNLSYLVPGALDDCDAVLACSEFVVRKYRDTVGIESTALPLPMDMDDVRADEREPIFVTMVNPSLEKGVFFFARMAEEISIRRPTIALLAIESRGSAGLLARAGLAGGFDLRRHENIMVSPPVPKPRDIYACTRVLVAPSIWEEPAGRVAAEAVINGVPPVVSDRGGLAETANGAALVLPIPAEITMRTTAPPPAAAVAPWVETIIRLADDEEFYRAASERAREAGRVYTPEALTPRYVKFFEDALR